MKKLLALFFICTFLFSNEYQEWLNKEEKKYSSYKKSLDEEFTKSLKDDWDKFNSMYNSNPYKIKKPETLPKLKKEIITNKLDLKKSKLLQTKKIIKKQINLGPGLIIEKRKDFTLLNFSFFSEKININIDNNGKYILTKYDKKNISNYWDIISKSNYKVTLDHFNKYTKLLNLNDWAKYLLIYSTGYELYKNKNMANLFTWFYLTKMKYDTKIAFNDNSLYLLSTIKHKLYQVAFFNIKNKRYYVLTPKGKKKRIESVFTYKQSYPDANKKLSFEMNKSLNFFNNIKYKKLTFKYLNSKYTVKSAYSLDLIKFYNTYPQSDYRIYFDTKNSNLLSQSLLNSLRPLIKGKKELDAVNFLLRFVQKSFKYKTDKENFSYEKVLFPEETLYYAYSDCEDRSIMFSFLIKNLTNLDIVAIKYQNHLSTAVKFSSQVKGSSVSFKGNKYIISDPTYINANAGMLMPKYKNASYEIISIK